MMGVRNRFQLSTSGCCFICLKEVPPKNVDEDDQGRVTRGMGGGRKRVKKLPPLETFSIHNLCRYLRLDAAKILSKRVSSSLHVPKSDLSFESSDVRVVMCESCAGMVTKFSRLFQELEVVRMKVGHCVDLIQKWIGDSDKDVPRVERFHKLMQKSDIKSLVFLDIVEELRNEVSKKCSTETANAQPKVTLNRVGTSTPRNKIKPSDTVQAQTSGREIKKRKVDFAKPLEDFQSEVDARSTSSLVQTAIDPQRSTKRSSPPPTLACSKEAVTEMGTIVQDTSSQCILITEKSATAKSVVNCNICEKGFNSLKDLNEHFTAVHPTSMGTPLARQAESTSIPETIGTEHNSDSHNVQPEAARIPNLETTRSRKRGLERSSAPCKISQVFQITSANKKPVEGPVKVVYVGQRPLIVPTISKQPNKNTIGTPSPPSELQGPYSCTDCELQFTFLNNLKLHSKITHGKTPEEISAICKQAVKISPQADEINTNAYIAAAINAVAMSAHLDPLRTISPGLGQEQQKMSDDDHEMEAACFEMSSNYESSQNIRGHWADPLSDVMITEVTETSNNSSPFLEASSAGNIPALGSSAIPIHTIQSIPVQAHSYNPPLLGPSTCEIYRPTDSFPTTLQSYNANQVLQALQMQNPTIPGTLQLGYSTAQFCTHPMSSSSTTGTSYDGGTSPAQASFSTQSATGFTECRLCGKQFIDGNAFQYHYNAEHLDLPFACNQCGKMFADDVNLREHIEKFHEVKYDTSVSCDSAETIYPQTPVMTNTADSNSVVPISIILPGGRTTRCNPKTTTDIAFTGN